MASASGEVTVGPSEIRSQVNKFLRGTSAPDSHVNLESLSSSALFLLRTVPVARHAVLEHYSNSFDDAINSFLSYSDRMPRGDHDPSPHQKKQLSALRDVTGVLLSFIKSNPEAWAPVVSSWALGLLGQLSSKYAARRGTQHATSLDDVLQMWLACQPAHLLMEISTECFAAMVGSAPDMCVDSLLEASVIYSPHFDWVVAHIGSCFPRTIITRVLNCGLKDFCSDSVHSKDGSQNSAASRLKVPKMASVVGILGHLASKHAHDIRRALMALFEASLNSDSQSSKVTTLPFLLQLASMSDLLLHILSSDLIAILDPASLNKLHGQFIQWKRASPADYNSFLNLVVHLIVKSRIGACDIISFILSTAVPAEDSSGAEKPVEEVRDTCVEILHILLFELQRGILSRKGEMPAMEIPLLVGLANQVEVLTNLLLHAEGRRLPWLQKLLTYTALHAGESCAATILSLIICNARTPQQLSNFYRLKQGIEIGIPEVMSPTLQQVFNRIESLAAQSASAPNSANNTSSSSSPSVKVPKCSQSEDVATSNTARATQSSGHPQLVPLKNLERIVAIEKAKMKKKLLSCSLIIKEIQPRLTSLIPDLLSCGLDLQRTTLTLVHLVGFPTGLGAAILTRLAGAVAQVFFTSLHQRAEGAVSMSDRGGGDDNNTNGKRHLGDASSGSGHSLTRLCLACVEQLSDLPYIRSLLIQYLVEGATHKEHCHLFGGKWTASLFGSSLSLSNSSNSTTSASAGDDVHATTTSSLSSSASDLGCLLQENRQQGNSIALPRFHSSVYHGGVIRQTNKPSGAYKLPPQAQVRSNILTLVEAVWLCCREARDQTATLATAALQHQHSSAAKWGAPATSTVTGAQASGSKTEDSVKPGQQIKAEESPNIVIESSARTLGCVIVDILTLDSLYNDVNWQDPDFRKVTTERDILVWKRLGDMSFLWSILQEFSSSCVFLYYASPVLRSLVSVVMNHLEVSREARMRNCPQHTEAAVKLVYCLTQGSWIPSPLSNVSELFPYVTPYEGYLLLLSLWRFIKERPPSEFESEVKGRTCDSSHMFIVNSIIHANIDNIGHLCTRIFNM